MVLSSPSTAQFHNFLLKHDSWEDGLVLDIYICPHVCAEAWSFTTKFSHLGVRWIMLAQLLHRSTVADRFLIHTDVCSGDP